MKRHWWMLSIGVYFFFLLQYLLKHGKHELCDTNLWTLAGDDFEGFDNETGVRSGYIVPNYVHFLRVGAKMKEFNFIDTVVVLSALKNQKPDKIFFHTDQVFTGHFWNVLVHTEGFMDVVDFVPTKVPEEIYGQKFNREYHLFHAGDILRIRLLMKYGGIFLDNDSYVVKSLDSFRKFEMALGWDEDQSLGTQVLIAHKDARFLRLWEYTYKDNYKGDLWYYNAGVRPTEVLLRVRPELVHRVKLQFGVHELVYEIYQDYWEHWRKQYTIHMLVRHTKWAGNWPYKLPKEFTVDNIHNYSTTLNAMVHDVFNFTLHRLLLKH